MKKTIWLAAFVAAWTGLPAFARCSGENLIDALPPEMQAEIHQAVAKIPYHDGILWRATKDNAQITLVGTYHFPDPRHQETIERLAGEFQNAAALYVEAGPTEEARLTQALTNDPSLMVNSSGPKLSERLSSAEWQTVSDAMSERGLPPAVTQNLKPWYIAMMTGISPCMLQQMTVDGDEGLDHLLIRQAASANLPVRALEPWDTALTLFDDLTPEQEENLIRTSLPAATYADDYAITLTDAYFSGDIWTIWEFGRFDAYAKSGLSRSAVDELLNFAQARLMNKRNQNWIAPLTKGAEEAAKDGKGIIAGFGALHLPGEQGVLNLLEGHGWKIEALR